MIPLHHHHIHFTLHSASPIAIEFPSTFSVDYIAMIITFQILKVAAYGFFLTLSIFCSCFVEPYGTRWWRYSSVHAFRIHEFQTNNQIIFLRLWSLISFFQKKNFWAFENGFLSLKKNEEHMEMAIRLYKTNKGKLNDNFLKQNSFQSGQEFVDYSMIEKKILSI